MILPASIKRKWKLLATAFICPLTLIGVGIQQQTLQAQPSSSKLYCVSTPERSRRWCNLRAAIGLCVLQW